MEICKRQSFFLLYDLSKSALITPNSQTYFGKIQVLYNLEKTRYKRQLSMIHEQSIATAMLGGKSRIQKLFVVRFYMCSVSFLIWFFSLYFYLNGHLQNAHGFCTLYILQDNSRGNSTYKPAPSRLSLFVISKHTCYSPLIFCGNLWVLLFQRTCSRLSNHSDYNIKSM